MKNVKVNESISKNSGIYLPLIKGFPPMDAYDVGQARKGHNWHRWKIVQVWDHTCDKD